MSDFKATSEKLSTPTRRVFTPPNLHGFIHVITSLNYNTLASPNLHRKFTRIFLHRLEPFYAAKLRHKITPQNYAAKLCRNITSGYIANLRRLIYIPTGIFMPLNLTHQTYVV